MIMIQNASLSFFFLSDGCLFYPVLDGCLISSLFWGGCLIDKWFVVYKGYMVDILLLCLIKLSFTYCKKFCELLTNFIMFWSSSTDVGVKWYG